MKKITVYIIAGFVALLFINTGCKDLTNVTPNESIPAIKSVIPAEAPYGGEVVIGGTGFGSELTDQVVLFNETPAQIDALSDTVLQTRVPLDAQSGPVKIITRGDTLVGPSFTVDTTRSVFLAIDRINPSQGRPGDTVDVVGTGFDENPAQNEMFFNEISAPVIKVNDTLLTTKVPLQAETGPVSVIVGQDTTVGPVFTVQKLIIAGISPESGPAGTAVTIEGGGFSSVKSENTVTFNGAEAPLETASETELLAIVPEDATMGPVKVTVHDQTVEGPAFTVEKPQPSRTLELFVNTSGEPVDEDGYTLSVSGRDDRAVGVNDELQYTEIQHPEVQVTLSGLAENCVVEGENPRTVMFETEKASTTFAVTCSGPELAITDISPVEGPAGTEVTIFGSGFSSVESENSVRFNGTEATVNSATETKIITEVPEEATDGPMEVRVGDTTVTGPDFDVISTGTLEVAVTTSGSDQDPNGYLLSLDGSDGIRVEINDSMSRSGLAEGGHEVHISDIASNCYPTWDFPNPRTVEIIAGQTTTIEYNISCEGTNEPPVASFEFSCTNLTCDFDASPSSDDESIAGYEWAFDDGTSGTGQTISHSFEVSGSYSVQLTVTDNEGATGIAGEEITVTAPGIKGISPESGPVGTEVTISGSGFKTTKTENQVTFSSGSGRVDAPVKSASETQLVVDVPTGAATGPVEVEVNGYIAQGPTFTVEQPKSLQVTIETTGSDIDEDGYTLSVSGMDDRLVKTNDDLMYYNLFVDEVQVQLSGIVDNCTVEGENPRNVILNNSDNAGLTSFTVICSALPPEITGISPEAESRGTEVLITGINFSPTASENIVTFNGVRAELNSASETELAAVVPGDATTGPVNVTVGNQTAEGPVFTVEVVGSLEVNISTTGSSLDPDGYLLSLEGSDDRSVKTNDTVIYEKLDVGSYQVGLSDITSNCHLSEELPNPRTVDVTENNTTTTDFNMSCSDPNEPPVASFSAECTNLSCLFDATGSSDSDGSIVSYEWQFGDGTGGAESSVTNNYEVPGTYTVQLTVADDDGAMDSRSEEITVTLPEITGISPEAGPVGTAVTISGNGFSSVRSENSVTFNGVEAALETASQTELMAIVPESATTGPVAVTVDGYTIRGPDFTVQEPKTLEVVIETVGSQIDGDGYTLSVTGRDDRFIKVNDNAQYSEIYDDQVQVELSGIAENCRVGGENPRTVVLNNSDNAGFTSFALDCTYDLRGKIVFSTDRHNYGELYKQNGDGSAVERITESTDYYEYEPVISPDGLQIVFSNNKGGGKHILVMDSDGSDVQQITDSGYNTAPSWSPDGSKILLARSGSSDEPSDIYIMNSDGSNLQNITNTDMAREFNPDWSSDGTSIVYEGYIDGKYDIYTINPDGTNKTQITDNDVSEYDPEWSPIGDKIVYVVNLPDASRKIHIMNSDGTGVQELTSSNGNERSPSWSPDGSKIVFSKYLDGYTHIYIYSVEFNDILVAPYTTGNDRTPHWNYK